MRLIDSDALGVGRCSKDVLPAAYCAGWNGLLNIINDSPTIDPVHAAGACYCWECELGKKSINCPGMIYCNGYHYYKNQTDFCSCGVRKDGNEMC